MKDTAIPPEAIAGPELSDLRHDSRGYLSGPSGVLPRQELRTLVQRRIIRAPGIEESQYQPASLDLRLGANAYRVRASFLPGVGRTVEQLLEELHGEKIDLRQGAVLERNCVYIVELQEFIRKLPESISGTANPKSSTGRLDVFTRLITDGAEVFDSIAGGYSGKLYAEISPCSFSVKVRTGSRLNQVRFRRRGSSQDPNTDFSVSDRNLQEIHQRKPIVDGELKLRNGLVLHVDLSGADHGGVVGYRAQRHTDIIDMDRLNTYAVVDYWEPILENASQRLILDPHQFYILVSKERLHIPPEMAAEMVPIDPSMGEFRVHYAGFFDPGFGYSEHGHPGSRAVLEVRSHEIPFVLQDGQVIGRLAYEGMTSRPDGLYGEIGTSNYQGQSLKLSKHFRA